MAEFKELVHKHCEEILRQKIKSLALSMEEMKTSMENETKSSVGDKHETSRARMQSELEKLGWQMDEFKSQYDLLLKQNPTKKSEIITQQSLVRCNKVLFYISVPIGKIELQEKVVYAISSLSPLGKNMMGLKTGETFHVNGISYKVDEIF